MIHPRSLFSLAKTTQKGPWAKPTQTSHRFWPRRKSSRSPFFFFFPPHVRVLKRAARRKWNSQVESITLWHYTPSNSHVYQLLKHTLLVKKEGGSGCKPLGDIWCWVCLLTIWVYNVTVRCVAGIFPDKRCSVQTILQEVSVAGWGAQALILLAGLASSTAGGNEASCVSSLIWELNYFPCGTAISKLPPLLSPRRLGGKARAKERKKKTPTPHRATHRPQTGLQVRQIKRFALGVNEIREIWFQNKSICVFITH